ncbi:MAG: glycosyltransferase, partial [Staphylococcus simulans]|nr:glycosyltransferase [Staphylococcus simulans]
REGMPRSIIEAMAMKNAVLATNIRGSREEVIHEETGFLFPVNSSEDIAKYITELANNTHKLNQMKNAGLARARALYDENKVVEKQLEIFKKSIITQEV